jgi:hypothetical protein
MAEAKNLATGLNEFVMLREIEALDVLYYVGKRKPISELTPEQQERVREAYKDTHWSSDYGVEAQGIYTSKALAEEACKRNGPNWFYHALPINSCLPDETVFFRAHVFPGSAAAQMYENLAAATVAVPVSYLRALEEIAKQNLAVGEETERLIGIIKTARETALKSP